MSGRLTPITVPKWGMTMEEGKLIAWLVGEGAAVTKGEEIADIETAKIANTVEAPASGRIGRIVAQIDQTLPVGALLAVLVDGEAESDELDAFVSGFGSAAPGVDEVVSAEPQFVEIHGRSTRYFSVGSEHDAKLPILLLHGLFGDLDSWMFVRDRLAADRRVVALDLPGHGGSSKDVAGGTLDSLADAVADFAEAVGLTRAHVVGHSLGGAVGLRLASRYPALVASLVTIAGLGQGSPIDRGFVRGMLDAKRARDLWPTAEMLFGDTTLLTRNFVENIIKFKRLDGVENALAALAQTAISISETDHLTTDRNTSIPMLAIVGDRDRVVPAPASLPEGIGAVRLPVGHLVQMEAPSEVAQAVAHFLADRG